MNRTAIVLGKKCPACKGQQIAPQLWSSRLAILPFAKSFTCTECHQQLVALFPFSIGIENRNFVRKRLPPFFLVRIHTDSARFARIRNISEGGICFDHHTQDATLLGHVLMIDIYNCNEGSSLEKLSAEIVGIYEQQLGVKGLQSTGINKCARFINLNKAQRAILQSCLTQYGMPL